MNNIDIHLSSVPPCPNCSGSKDSIYLPIHETGYQLVACINCQEDYWVKPIKFLWDNKETSERKFTLKNGLVIDLEIIENGTMRIADHKLIETGEDFKKHEQALREFYQRLRVIYDIKKAHLNELPER